MRNSEALTKALEYIKAIPKMDKKEWYVFPTHSILAGKCTCGNHDCSQAGKHPRTKNGLKDGSKDPEQIKRWWADDAPLSNVGIVTGEISGITVLDIDIAEGKLGAESWAEVIDGHGEPNTLAATTGSGGTHFIFQYSSYHKNAANVLGKGVDCRNDNGYIVASPSLHKSGGKYSWDNWGDAICHLPSFLNKRVETRGREKKENKNDFTINQVEAMLEVIPSTDRDLWRNVGIILGRVFDKSDEAWEVYNEWADKDCLKKGNNHDKIMSEAFYTLSQTEGGLTIGTIIKLALENGWAPKKGNVPLSDFIYYGPGNNYIYRNGGTFWIGAAVDSAVSPINVDGKIINATEWLKSNRLATAMTSDPSSNEVFIKGFSCEKGEIITAEGAALYNTYKRASIRLGDAKLALPFINHVRKMFNKPGDSDQFLNYMAHRVQKPWEKPRFALLIAGGQGIGKDSAVGMCCPAIGAWNVANISPANLNSNFDEYAAATLIRISEAANLQEMSKWAFNEVTKVLIAGGPDEREINPKYGQKFFIKLYCGVIITTNHLASGIYIPEDDRRYDVIETASLEEMGFLNQEFKAKYFEELWSWYYSGGKHHIAALLNEIDISKFSPSNGQRKTDAHKMVVSCSFANDTWLTDALEYFDEQDLVRTDWLINKICEDGTKKEGLPQKILPTMSRLGYVFYRNPAVSDGRWKVCKKWISIYAKKGTKMVSCKEELPEYITTEMFI